MTSPTPGPWHVSEREGRALGQYGHHVASSHYSRTGVGDGRDSICDVRGGDSQEEWLANARLIAAAPALLAACEAALPFYETCDDPDADRVASLLRSALAQAKGGV